MHTNQMIAIIDAEADIIRARVVGDPVRAFEYQWAENEANAFKAAGYTGTVPPSIAAWAQAKNWTSQQAADDVLQAAANFRSAMSSLRTTRLIGKETIRNAATEEIANAAYVQTMATLAQIRAAVM
jgi:hypothetical protein